MMWLKRWGTGSRLALTGLVLAVAGAAWAGIEAWRLDALPSATASPGVELTMASVSASGEAAPMSVVFTAVARDPFRADRSRPSSRYLLPGERTAATMAASRANLRPTYTGLALMGTAVRPEGGIAVLQVPRQAAQLVRVGDSIAGLELVSVERRRVTLSGADTTLMLELPGPPSEAQRRAAADSSRADSASNGNTMSEPAEGADHVDPATGDATMKGIVP
jgi:hypothetical protein